MSRRPRATPFRLGLAAAGLALALGLAAPAGLDHAATDALLAARPRPAAPLPVTVVEIDRASLAALGPWPWPRARLAELVDALTGAGAAAVLLDILFDGPDRQGEAALARRLAEALAADPHAAAEAAALAARAATLPDHDAQLLRAVAAGPVALGFVLAPEPSAAPPLPGGFALRGDPAGLAPLAAPGVVAPPFAAAAAGLGAISLDGTVVRRVPLLVLAGGEWRPGLVTEGLRLATGAGSPVLDAAAGLLRLGPVALPVDAALAVRLHPADPARLAARSLAAAAVLGGTAPAARLAGHVVLVGGTAPETGGLRGLAGGRSLPGVQIQAEALEQALSGWLPLRPAGLLLAERGAAALAGIAGAAAGAWLPPALAALATLGLAAGLWLGALALLEGALLLASPALALLALLAGVAGGGIAGFAALRASRARLAARFAQSLPPAVVARIAAEPGLLRIGGERRRMSFVFTDIAGFTALAERAGPERLIALLDAYIAGAAEVIAQEGGTLDKVVGDALHVMFGAPLHDPDHPRRALRCGQALAAFGARFAAAPEAAALGFGATRIGIATGEAVVGDVGGGRVLDYTAHGDAVNLAARLEQACKLFGTPLLADGATAAACPAAGLRPLGRLVARGRAAEVEVFAPLDAPAAVRAAWDAAMAALARGEAAAAEAGFRAVLAACPDDGPAAFHLARLARGEAGLRVDQRG